MSCRITSNYEPSGRSVMSPAKPCSLQKRDRKSRLRTLPTPDIGSASTNSDHCMDAFTPPFVGYTDDGRRRDTGMAGERVLHHGHAIVGFDTGRPKRACEPGDPDHCCRARWSDWVRYIGFPFLCVIDPQRIGWPPGRVVAAVQVSTPINARTR